MSSDIPKDEKKEQAMIRSNPYMTVEELNTCLQQYGYYVRETKTIDESIPLAKWVIITPSSDKIGCNSYIELATQVRRIENAAFGNSEEQLVNTTKELTHMATTTANTVQTIALSAIDTTNETYRIRGINEEHLESLMFSEPKEWVPVVLTKIDDSTYAIVSGFHRVEAAKQKQLETIKAKVTTENLTEDEIRLFAYKYNSDHGLPLTMEQKKRYAVLLHLQNVEMPHYKIAMLAHISDKTVTEAIRQHLNPTEAATEDTTEDTTEDITEDGEQEQVSDEEKVVKSLLNAVRSFYKTTRGLNDDDIVTLLVKYATKKETNKYVGDDSVLDYISGLLSDTHEALKPKPTKAAKTPKTPKASKKSTKALDGASDVVKDMFSQTTLEEQIATSEAATPEEIVTIPMTQTTWNDATKNL